MSIAEAIADGKSPGLALRQALTALDADPLNRQALASCQMAIGELQTAEKQHENSWLLPSLRSAIVTGLNTALERVSAISAAPAYEAATVIQGELRRLGVHLCRRNAAVA